MGFHFYNLVLYRYDKEDVVVARVVNFLIKNKKFIGKMVDKDKSMMYYKTKN